jgi:hypothetical protein
MINSGLDPAGNAADSADAVDGIVRSGPRGALVLAGISTALVIALWLAFYLLVFVPRATPS